MDFKAERDINGKLHVKPIIERKGNNVTIHVPSFPLIHKLSRELDKK